MKHICIKRSCFLLICFFTFAAQSQELEPRVYAALPKGMNAIALLYGISHGNVISDPSLPVSDFTITAHTAGFAYVHTFGLLNKLARIQVAVPYFAMAGQLKVNGVDTSGSRSGFGDTRIRFGINLTGSPPLARKDFVKYTQKTIIGVSLVTSVPTGLYLHDKLINIGSNRWAFKPEVGISKKIKSIYAEFYTGVWFYTNNSEYLGKKLLSQKPVLSFQGHVSYYFKNRMFVGLNGNWFNGGATSVDGIEKGDLRDNWRVGATWSVPFLKTHSIKLQLHTGAFTKSGYDYDMLALSYQYIFF